MVSFGRYFTSAFSTNVVKLSSSTIAWALACLIREGLINRVTRCLYSVVIIHMVLFIVAVVYRQYIQVTLLMRFGLTSY